MITTKFKPGTREEALKIVDEAQKEKVDGFIGILAFLHEDDPDTVSIVSVWDSEETLNTSRTGIFQDIMSATEHLMVGSPEIKNLKVRDMRGQLIPVRA